MLTALPENIAPSSSSAIAFDAARAPRGLEAVDAVDFLPLSFPRFAGLAGLEDFDAGAREAVLFLVIPSRLEASEAPNPRTASAATRVRTIVSHSLGDSDAYAFRDASTRSHKGVPRTAHRGSGSLDDDRVHCSHSFSEDEGINAQSVGKEGSILAKLKPLVAGIKVTLVALAPALALVRPVAECFSTRPMSGSGQRSTSTFCTPSRDWRTAVNCMIPRQTNKCNEQVKEVMWMLESKLCFLPIHHFTTLHNAEKPQLIHARSFASVHKLTRRIVQMRRRKL